MSKHYISNVTLESQISELALATLVSGSTTTVMPPSESIKCPKWHFMPKLR